MTLAHIGHGFLATALEGGIGYWARAYDIEREQLEGPLAMENFEEYTSVKLVEFEDAADDLDLNIAYNFDALDVAFEEGKVPSAKVTANDLQKFFLSVINPQTDADLVNRQAVGMHRAAQWMIAFSEDQDYPDLDAEDADVMVQIVALGSVVYG